MHWHSLRQRLTIFYLAIALILLALSTAGHLRLLKEVNSTFGGFFWAIDTDGQVVVVSTPSQLPSFAAGAASLISNPRIVAINQQVINKGAGSAITDVYRKALPGDSISYTIAYNENQQTRLTSPVVRFTWDMWWQHYGFALLAGLSWLIVGAILLATAPEWTGAVEGITMLPPAMLFLLSSHWGNIQQATPPDLVFQLLWVPAFALLGAAFIHLSLIYRPELLRRPRRPHWLIDGLPYLPLLTLFAYEWSSLLISGRVPTRIHLIASLSYAALGGILSLVIGIYSLSRTSRFFPAKKDQQEHAPASILPQIRQRIAGPLTLWIGSIGLCFCLIVSPILLTGQMLLPFSTFLILAAIYPLILFYVIRSLRLLDRLQVTLNQREAALNEQQKTVEELRSVKQDLEQTQSLLLHADAHLRLLLSQRIHDQPKQQALRIRSLLGHWQHKLRVEAERDRTGKVAAQPIIEAFGKVRKISEELESDLHGLQLLVEDLYQRRSLGLKLHLDKLIREDLPHLYEESSLQVQADLWALDAFPPDLEQTEKGSEIAEIISYTVTQALLTIYDDAAATFATVRTTWSNGILEITITDNGRGFDLTSVPHDKSGLFKAKLKVREIGGTLTIHSVQRPQTPHGTTVSLRVPLPHMNTNLISEALTEPDLQATLESHHQQ
jgi:hypothetical protein